MARDRERRPMFSRAEKVDTATTVRQSIGWLLACGLAWGLGRAIGDGVGDMVSGLAVVVALFVVAILAYELITGGHDEPPSADPKP